MGRTLHEDGHLANGSEQAINHQTCILSQVAVAPATPTMVPPMHWAAPLIAPTPFPPALALVSVENRLGATTLPIAA
jgi:hypothetical protein